MVQQLTLSQADDRALVIDGSLRYEDTLANFETDFSTTIPNLTADIQVIQFYYGDSTATVYRYVDGVSYSEDFSWSTSTMEALIDGTADGITAKIARGDSSAAVTALNHAGTMTYLSAQTWADNTINQFIELIFVAMWNNSANTSPTLAANVVSQFQLGSDPYKQKFYDLCGQMGLTVTDGTNATTLTTAQQQVALQAATMIVNFYIMSTLIDLDSIVRT